MAFTMPACLVMTSAGVPSASSTVSFVASDGVTALTPYAPGTTTAVTSPKTNANGMIGPFDFNVEWGYIKAGTILQPFATTAVNDLARKGTITNPYVNPVDTTALANGSFYVTYDTGVTTKSTRFAKVTNGAAVGVSNTDTAALANNYGATFVGTSTSPLYGSMSAQFTGATNTSCPIELSPVASQTEFTFHVVMTMPALDAGSNMDLLWVDAGSTLALVLVADSTTAHWKCWQTTVGEVLGPTNGMPAAGSTFRLAVAVNMSTSTIRFGFFTGDTSTPIGTVQTLTGCALSGSVGKIAFGQCGYSGTTARTMKIGAVRANYGPGTSANLLNPESTYS